MVINYLGKQFFKITHGDLTLATNPSGKGRFGADVVFVSTKHKDYNQTDLVSFGDKQPFVISGPGDYEIKGVTAQGFYTETETASKFIELRIDII